MSLRRSRRPRQVLVIVAVVGLASVAMACNLDDGPSTPTSAPTTADSPAPRQDPVT